MGNGDLEKSGSGPGESSEGKGRDKIKDFMDAWKAESFPKREKERFQFEEATREDLQNDFEESLNVLKEKLNELKPHLPEEYQKKEKLPPVFDFRNYPFPENVSKHDYAISQTIMEANIEMAERELELLREGGDEIDEQEKEKRILDILSIIDKNMRDISESLQRSESEQLELKEIELGIENKYRLIGHREGMIEVSKKMIETLEKELKELEKNLVHLM